MNAHLLLLFSTKNFHLKCCRFHRDIVTNTKLSSLHRALGKSWCYHFQWPAPSTFNVTCRHWIADGVSVSEGNRINLHSSAKRWKSFLLAWSQALYRQMYKPFSPHAANSIATDNGNEIQTFTAVWREGVAWKKIDNGASFGLAWNRKWKCLMADKWKMGHLTFTIAK